MARDTVTPMTGKISDFGSLTDRVEQSEPRSYQPTHAWLDGSTPVLVSDWRRTEHGWQALTIRAVVSGAALEWIDSVRLRRR